MSARFWYESSPRCLLLDISNAGLFLSFNDRMLTLDSSHSPPPLYELAQASRALARFYQTKFQKFKYYECYVRCTCPLEKEKKQKGVHVCVILPR